MSKENALQPIGISPTSKSQLKSQKTRVSNAPRNSAMLRRRMQSSESADETASFSIEGEIRQFLDTVPVIPKLPKMPDIGKYVKKGKTVHRNKTAGDRNSIIKNYMDECAVTQKIDMMMAGKSAPIDRQEERKMPQAYYRKLIRGFANTVEPTPMQESWIENIIEKSKVVRSKKTKVSASLIDEVKVEYSKVLKKLHVDGIVKPISSQNVPVTKKPQEEPLSIAVGGKTKNYSLFLKKKKLLEKRLHLTHPTTVKVLHFTKRQVPKMMINAESYKFNEFSRDLDDLMATLEHDFRKQDAFLAKDWYKKIIIILSKKGAMDGTTLNVVPQFLKGVTTVISLEMERMILKSMDHIVNVFGNVATAPKLNFKLHFVGSKCISSPSVSEIWDQYCSFLNLLHSAVSELPSLEYHFGVPVSCQFISIKRCKIYLNEAKTDLGKKLDVMYKELTGYLNKMENDFIDVVNEKLPESLSIYLHENHTYEELLEKLDLYQSYKNKASELVDGWNFELGNIDQVDLKNYLRDLAKNYMDRVIDHTVIKQLSSDEKVCYKFNEMVSRAVSKPKNSEEFLALGDYMLYASTTFMTEMTQMVKDLTVVACNMSQYAILPKEFWDAHASSVKWIQNISPVFFKYSTIYEVGKSNAEETLAKVISTLNYDLDAFAPNLTFLDRIDDVNKLYEYKLFISTLQRKIEKFDDTVAWINREEVLFNKPISTFPELDEIKDFTRPFVNLITFSYCWFLKKNIWIRGDFNDLSLPEIEITVDEFYNEALKMQNLLKVKCKEMSSQNYSKRYEGIIDDEDPNLWPAPLKISHQTINSMKDFKQYMPIIRIMCNPALTERHWEEMSEFAGFDLTPNAGTTLGKIIDFHLDELLPQFDVISISATKEEQLRKSLQKMKEDWMTIFVSTSPYKDTNINILDTLEDIHVVLDDHLIKTTSIRGSAFVKPIENEVTEWLDTLNRMTMALNEWARVQIRWLYLMPIFVSKDIVAQMPEEGILFNEINDIVKGLLGTIDSDSLAIRCIGEAGVLESLINCSKMIETINLGVHNYLEKKRLFFPRFFFLSNIEILEILSETTNPKRVQPYLKKCFEGIAKLKFDNNLDIFKFVSSEGEEIAFNRHISTTDARGSVEKWLKQVEKQMTVSIKKCIEDAYSEYSTIERIVWVQKWPGQCIVCVSQMFWTAEVHDLFIVRKSGQMRSYYNFLTNQLNNIVSLLRGKLSKQTRISISALVTLDVHCRDVVDTLAKNNVFHDTDFKWLSQLRYYWEDDVLVRNTNTTINYAYEYLGNTSRLVITPLTERCYCTLISAYNLHLNGATEGPAGSGKTETVKDLGKALAVHCVVFNCSAGLDYLAMGKFFKGLASSGAWVCLDDFDRIDVEVLSVIAQQILSITQAVKTNLDTFVFEGTELKLNPRCYVCITMNPGYAGRSELPDNLKVLFRSVAMMVPDFVMIGEVSLYSNGFINAKQLSVKIITAYKLCSEQFSTQLHYDYGLRAIKAVLIAARDYKIEFPDDSESEILLRSILDINLAKLLKKDITLFNGIMSDLFPHTKFSNPNQENLVSAAKTTCAKMNFQPTVTFIEKLIQTHEIMKVKSGFILVGNPFGGKTSILNLLAETLNLQNQLRQIEEKVEYETVNPKALNMDQLYGRFDEVSHEWSNGVVANIFKQFSMSETSNKKWLIFDGPIDAVWIENMNTVLDDNKKLCLCSGEVISMPDCMSMIFEVMDLTQASPATVSRCGMIYLDPLSLGWRPLIESWKNTCSEFLPLNQNGINFMDLFDWITAPCLSFIRLNCVQLTNAGEINAVQNVSNILEMQLKNASIDNSAFKEHFTNYLLGSFVYASIWGFGGTLCSNSRPVFDLYFKELWRCEIPTFQPPETLRALEFLIPSDGTLYDYVYNCTSRGSWKNVAEIIRNCKVEEINTIEQNLVQTMDTARFTNLVDLFISHRKPLLLFGPTGTGKSFYLKNYMMTKLPLDEYVPSFVKFTIQTSANFTQDMILSKLIKRKRGVYGPPFGRVCVVFVDDMNMPAKDQYGAQPPIELLRQLLDYKHWYDLQDTSKVYLKDILLLSAISPTGGSRQEVSARFLRHFGLFAINSFDDETITKIFSTLLQVGLKKNGFTSEVVPIIDNITQSTIDLYRSAILNLTPTPVKSHYLFNLRDISKVTDGILMFRKESFTNRRIFVRLWVHEVMRVFYDRLINDEDRKWLFDEIRIIVNTNFQETFDVVFNNLSDSAPILFRDMQNLLFTDVMSSDILEDKKYEESLSLINFKEIAQIVMDEYDKAHKSKLNLVLFNYALEHLSRICRILSIPRGCALLVGVGGSGRQSITRLASAMCKSDVFQPNITKEYGLNEWRNDLKAILKESGGKNRSTVFLLTEKQIKYEYFLEDIDALLNSGEVPNLFTLNEQQSILEMVRLAAQGGNRNLDIAPLVVFNYFINCCKRNLHVCLCLSPIGSTLRNYLRLYPSIVSCCTIDWFEEWPKDALEMVAHTYLEDVNLSDSVKNVAVRICHHFHKDARRLSLEFFSSTRHRTYVTSVLYLDLIKSYTDCTNRKQKEIMEAKMRYVGGLQELEYATVQVSQMKEDLFKLQPQLQKAQKDTEEMMVMISRETVEVEKATARVQEDEKVANIQAEAANELKTECEADLALAIPVLEDAIDALNTLKPTDITLVKSMKNPPEMVKTVMAAVCVMKGVSPDKVPDPNKPGQKILDYWGPSKRILGDINFLQRLKEYDKDNIPSQIMTIIRKTYLPDPNFKPPIVAKASSAAEGLCKWIIALDMYDQVIKVVAPKKEKLEIANAEYEATMTILEEKRNEVRQLQIRLDFLKDRLKETELNKEKLLAEVMLCESKLLKAEKLIGSLGGEKHRWAQRAEELQTNYDCIPGNILISCGIIAYLAPFTSHIRASVIYGWKILCDDLKIPSSRNYSLVNVLGVPIKIQNWTINGLPMDSFSIDNAIIMDESERWSLLIDPQGQAHKWIKTMETLNDIIIVKINNPNYMKNIEFGIEFGKSVLIENVLEDLDLSLDPILLKRTYTQGSSRFIEIGDHVIEYNPKFRLYITTKLRNPHYLPEIFNKVTIINFELTVEGLEDQLLGIVMAKERPDLESKRQQLIVESAENARALLDVENNILQILSAPGNILEDENAVDVLDNSKILAKNITQKQAASVETVTVIDQFRLQFKPIAIHCSILYYCITDLPNLDPMYQYSLTWFINIFIMTIETANKSKIIQVRQKSLKETFTYNLYANICQSLFEKDKTLFSFIMCTTIMLAEKKIDKEELLFLTAVSSITKENGDRDLKPEWLLDKSWDELCRLDKLNVFNGIKDDLVTRMDEWKNYYDSNDQENSQFPNPWYDNLNEFQRIIVVRVIRPDRVIPRITQLIGNELGEKFICPPPFDIHKCYGDSTCSNPLIFVLSPGLDPMASLLQFADKTGKAESLKIVSMGQGQSPVAESVIRNARKTGGWICLQNVHLATSWMGQLEVICDSFNGPNTNSEFRLWLTSCSSEKFPVSVLQNGVKMTNEQPNNLQANVLRSYRSYPVRDHNFFEGCPGKEQIFTKLLYGITFFHAVALERRQFGPIGWNVPYGFDESDYHISIQQLQMFINEFDEVPFDAVIYLTGECNYGGRVTDDWDRRLMNTILKTFCCPQVVENPYYLFCDVSRKYGIPYRTNYHDFVKQIKEMPTIADPEVFGLHSNSAIVRDAQATQRLFESFASVTESSGGAGADAAPISLTEIASGVLARLPNDFDVETASTRYPVAYGECMNAVLVQEMERFNALSHAIRESLLDLMRAANGTIAMTPALEAVAMSLSAGKCPAVWACLSYPSVKSLGGYITDFVERIHFFQVWNEEGTPDKFWLSGFFSAQSFLTGAMQNFARRHTIPIDQLCFDFQVQRSDEINSPPQNGVYCYGLFVDGARWDRSKMVLEEQFPKILTDKLPLVWFMPIKKNELTIGNRYTCPVYKTSDRKGVLSTTGHSTNYVLPLLLDTNKKPSHWIYRGVALLCQLKD